MTTPPGTPLAETGNHPDLELLIADLAARSCTTPDGDPIGPGAAGVSNDAGRTLFVYVEKATGAGGLDRHGITDTALIYIGTRAETRAWSQQLTRQLRDALRELADTHDHRGVLVDSCRESTPPAPQPGRDADERLVETGWVLTARVHRGAPVYA